MQRQLGLASPSLANDLYDPRHRKTTIHHSIHILTSRRKPRQPCEGVYRLKEWSEAHRFVWSTRHARATTRRPRFSRQNRSCARQKTRRRHVTAVSVHRIVSTIKAALRRCTTCHVIERFTRRPARKHGVETDKAANGVTLPMYRNAFASCVVASRTRFWMTGRELL